MTSSHLKEMRERLRGNKLTPEDLRYLEGLVAKADAEGLGEKIGDKRVIARLPHGMDIIK